MNFPVTLSRRALSMPPSPIRKLVPLADAAREQGVKIYHLNIGQPDIPTPPAMFDAAAHFHEDVLAYGRSEGEIDLRDEIARYYGEKGVAVDRKQIMITTGGSEAIIFAMASVCDDGDEIVVFEPFYTNYNGFSHLTGVRLSPVACRVEDGFALPPDEVIKNAITPKTKAIMVCNPNNPTGTVYPRQDLERIAQLCLERGFYLLADEVYNEFIYDGEKHTSALALEGLDDRVIVMDSISKRFSACGARVGNLVTRNSDLMSAFIRFGQARLCPPRLEQAMAVVAYRLPREEAIAPHIAEYDRRRKYMLNRLQAMPGVVAPMPKGAFYTICKLPIEDADKFAAWLLTDFRHHNETVMVAPASGFYATHGRGCDEVRIAYVLKEKELAGAMDCLQEALQVYPGC
jgi:aspartate aminotransferase